MLATRRTLLAILIVVLAPCLTTTARAESETVQCIKSLSALAAHIESHRPGLTSKAIRSRISVVLMDHHAAGGTPIDPQSLEASSADEMDSCLRSGFSIEEISWLIRLTYGPVPRTLDGAAIQCSAALLYIEELTVRVNPSRTEDVRAILFVLGGRLGERMVDAFYFLRGDSGYSLEISQRAEKQVARWRSSDDAAATSMMLKSAIEDCRWFGIDVDVVAPILFERES